MAGLRRNTPQTAPPVIQPDPQAFAPIPPPAPYLTPIWYGDGDRPLPHTDVQKYWANSIGNEPNIPPTLRRRYKNDTEYRRDLYEGHQDGIGHTDDPSHVSDGYRAPDTRWVSPPEGLGKRPATQVGNQDKYTYFRPYDQSIARRWDASKHPGPGMTPLVPDIRQGNYGIREWRLTARFDPTDGEPYDRTPPATSSRITEASAYSGVRRNLRI